MSYWGQPAGYDSLGMPTRWGIRKSPAGWSTHEPDGSWSRNFDSFHEALRWAVDPFERMGHWLANQ